MSTDMCPSWAEEPIECDDRHLKDAKGNLIVSPDCVVEQTTGNRLAACYNACAGIPTENLANQRLVKCNCGGIFLVDPTSESYKRRPESSGCDMCHGMSVRELFEANGIMLWEENDK